MKRLILGISSVLEFVERTVLITALTGMLLTVCAAIGARLLGTDVPWATPMVLALMIVAAFAGAALATATRRHITMDLLSKALGPKGRAAISLVVSVIGVGITSVLTVAGTRWVKANMEYDDPISLALKLPDWWLQAVAPTGFALCAIHFLLNFLLDARGLVTGDLSHLRGPDNAAAHGVHT